MRISTVLAFVLSLVLQVGYPLAVTLYYRHKTRAPWALFFYGVIVFAVFQLFTWLPLSVYLDAVVEGMLRTEWAAFVWLLALALATALIEEAGRWWGYRFLFPRGGFALTWRNGVMYGLGHGSLETLLLIAGMTFVHLIAYLALSRLGLAAIAESLGAETSAALLEALQALIETSWEQPLVVALERILALPHQIAWALLVMQSLASRQKRWFGFAVLYHWSVAVIVPGLARLAGFTLAEVANLALALPSLWIILRFRAMAEPAAHVGGAPNPGTRPNGDATRRSRI